MTDATMALPDGRVLSYAEHGVPDGDPLLLFHGIPGGRAFCLNAAAMAATGARVISVERPGFGLSDPKPDRSLLDWPSDVAALADELGFDTFAVVGASAGGPNALVCGYALPNRVRVVGLVCTLGPVFDHPEFDALLSEQFQLLLPVAREDRETALEVVEAFLAPTAAAWAEDPAAFFTAWKDAYPEADRARLTPDALDMMGLCIESTYVQGARTMVDEVGATYGPWGFDMKDVPVPVHLWHGDADESCAIEIARFVAGELPNAMLTEYPGEGHVPDISHHAEWLQTLVGGA